MKTFKEILKEYNEKRVYSFKVGIAGEVSPEMINNLETSLKKFNLVKMSSGKRTPIQKRPLDFPQLQNEEVTFFDIDVMYPTTSHVLHNYLTNSCGVPSSRMIVKTPGEESLMYGNSSNSEGGDIYEPLLTKEDMGGESAQKLVGQNRVMDLLKELEKANADKK